MRRGALWVSSGRPHSTASQWPLAMLSLAARAVRQAPCHAAALSIVADVSVNVTFLDYTGARTTVPGRVGQNLLELARSHVRSAGCFEPSDAVGRHNLPSIVKPRRRERRWSRVLQSGASPSRAIVFAQSKPRDAFSSGTCTMSSALSCANCGPRRLMPTRSDDGFTGDDVREVAGASAGTGGR